MLRPGDHELALDAWVLAFGAVGLATLVDATRSALPGPDRSPLDPSASTPEPAPLQVPELARVERIVALAQESAFDVHYRLRPLLREIAEHRLSTRRGIDLDTGADEAREALGESLWELVRPERERPSYHFASGLSLPELRATVEALEAV
ncbi:MAG: hypothetical protein H0V84_12850 [Actinobacteria bacterium]|nr:hypothetical protein [Actinomycetota bacterium]